MKIRFLGAAGTVTGSCTLIEDSRVDRRFLVDCGMTQGEGDAAGLNAQPWPFAAAKLDFVLLTHAHLDHCGLLPRLIYEGFTGPVYCTKFTAELAKLNLRDAAKFSAPAITTADVDRIRFVYVEDWPDFQFGRYCPLGKQLEVMFTPTAHIGGCCSVGVRWHAADNTPREIVFSGDLGPNVVDSAPQPLLAPREPLAGTPDYLVVESTYGGRNRTKDASASARLDHWRGILSSAIERTLAAGDGGTSTVVIPCFSIHRCQELLVDLHAVLEVLLRDQLVNIRPMFSDPEHLESMLRNGVRPARVTSSLGILSAMDEESRQRFYRLFKLQPAFAPKKGEVFLPINDDAATFDAIRQLLLHAQQYEQKIPVRVIVDSPLSHKATRVYRRELQKRARWDSEQRLWRSNALAQHVGVASEEELDSLLPRIFQDHFSRDGEPSLEKFPSYTQVFCHPSKSEEVMKAPGLNIVLSGSGMADVGPVVAHLQRHLSDPNTVVVLTGYAPPTTVAGQLKALGNTGSSGPEGRITLLAEEVADHEVKATIEDLSPYYSGHADQAGLLDFIFRIGKDRSSGSKATTVLLNHGGDEARKQLAEMIRIKRQLHNQGERAVRAVERPGRDEKWFDLDEGRWLEELATSHYQATSDDLLMRLLMEQRRTNDLLFELLRQQQARTPGMKSHSK